MRCTCSWKQHGREDYYTYAELTDELIDYVAEMGFTHIELLPILEHPPLTVLGGYQIMGYYAATSRHGHPPGNLCTLLIAAIKGVLGVILDWVPGGHFVRG